MLIVFRPAFFSGEDLCLCDMCSRVVFFPEVLWDPEAWLVVVAMRAWLLLALGDLYISFQFGVVILVCSGVCIKDV